MWKLKVNFRNHLKSKDLLFIPIPSTAYAQDEYHACGTKARSIYILWLFWELEFEFIKNYELKKPINEDRSKV